MKRLTIQILVGIVVLAGTAFLIAGERPWFDMQNCVFCKPWMETGLMKVMQDNQYPMSNGVVTVSTVPATRMADYKKVCGQMDALGKRAMSGEKLQMCQSCETMGSFFARGAKMEQIWTKDGSVSMLTSSDSTLVADMQKWAQRNMDERKKMGSAGAMK